MKRQSGWLSARTVLAAALVTCVLGGMWGVPASAQEWPRCASGCTANDLTVLRLYLRNAPTGCTPGTPATVELWADFDKNANAKRYCVYFVGDIYVGGTLTQANFWRRVADEIPTGTGTVTYKLADITWTCGALLEVRNILLFWDTSTKGCVDGSCEGYGTSKCWSSATGVLVEAPLVANFTHTAPVCHCTTIQFTDTTTGGTKPYTYSWTFGDGGTSTAQNPSYHYANPGTYEVTLTVRDSSSPQKVDSQAYSVTVWANPVANFSASPTSGCAPLTVTFTDASTSGSPNGGAITKWEWDFTNDGVVDRTDTSAPSPFSHTYTTPGTYSVRLKVTDANGCTNSLTRTGYITVQDCGADLGMTKTVNNATPNVGSNVVFTVTVTNHGPSGATGVVVNDLLPSGYSYVSHSASVGTYNSGTGVWTVGALGYPGSATLTITATVLASGTYLNTATVTATTADPNSANNSASASTTPVAQADVSVTKGDSPDPLIAGQTLTYTLVVANAGPSNAVNVVVTETYPAGFTYVSATLPPTSGNNVWNLGTLTSGQQVTITITGKVSASASGTLTNRVNVVSDTADPTPGNNSAEAVTTVNISADLAVTKASEPRVVRAGQTITYTIVVSNNGPSDAPHVTLTETYPAGFTFVSADPAPTSGNNVWNLGTIPVGGSKTVKITGTVAPGASGTLVNTVEVKSDPPVGGQAADDPQLGNNKATAQNGVAFYYSGFDGTEGWVSNGLWYIRNDVGCFDCNLITGPYVQFARLVEPCGSRTYDLGTSRAYGILTSPVIRPPAGSTAVYVAFDYFYQVERSTRDYDRMYCQVSLNGGTWQTIWSRSAKNGQTACGSYEHKLATVPSYFQIRFVFDSVDARDNKFLGWVVDNVRASTLPTSSGAAATTKSAELGLLAGDPAAELNVVNVPNPITDVHTTTFKVLGPQAAVVEQIWVRIFDLSGRLVWEGKSYGSSLDWHTDDLAGRYLANGVYLYHVQLYIGGTWVTTELKKLAIYR